MAKGLEKNQHRMGELAALGKDLARRSHSHCELCQAAGVRLTPFEVTPIAEDPELERTLFLCDVCRVQISQPKQMDLNHWHCLHAAIWSTIPVVQVMAIRMLKRIKPQTGWAADLWEQVYLEPDIEAWVNADD